jgi:hypothetical protein
MDSNRWLTIFGKQTLEKEYLFSSSSSTRSSPFSFLYHFYFYFKYYVQLGKGGWSCWVIKKRREKGLEGENMVILKVPFLHVRHTHLCVGVCYTLDGLSVVCKALIISSSVLIARFFQKDFDVMRWLRPPRFYSPRNKCLLLTHSWHKKCCTCVYRAQVNVLWLHFRFPTFLFFDFFLRGAGGKNERKKKTTWWFVESSRERVFPAFWSDSLERDIISLFFFFFCPFEFRTLRTHVSYFYILLVE